MAFTILNVGVGWSRVSMHDEFVVGPSLERVGRCGDQLESKFLQSIKDDTQFAIRNELPPFLDLLSSLHGCVAGRARTRGFQDQVRENSPC